MRAGGCLVPVARCLEQWRLQPGTHPNNFRLLSIFLQFHQINLSNAFAAFSSQKILEFNFELVVLSSYNSAVEGTVVLQKIKPLGGSETKTQSCTR